MGKPADTGEKFPQFMRLWTGRPYWRGKCAHDGMERLGALCERLALGGSEAVQGSRQGCEPDFPRKIRARHRKGTSQAAEKGRGQPHGWNCSPMPGAKSRRLLCVFAILQSLCLWGMKSQAPENHSCKECRALS